MAQCSSCGNPIPDGLAACPSCGAAINSNEVVQDQPLQGGNAAGTHAAIRMSSIIVGCISFLIPIVGLVLYLIWWKKNPQRARFAIIGAVVGIAFSIVFNIIPMMLAGQSPLALGQ